MLKIKNFYFRTAGQVFGSGLNALLSDWDKVMTAVGGLSLLALGFYTAKGSTSLATRFLEARLGYLNFIIFILKFKFLKQV